MSLKKHIPFYRRQMAARGELPTTFSYNFPQKVRNQLWLTWEAFGLNNIRVIVQLLQIEFGARPLPCNTYPQDSKEELLNFFSKTDNDEHALTVLESICRHNHKNQNLIGAINSRLQTEGIGYIFTETDNNGFLRQTEDTEFSQHVVEPCLSVLSEFPASQKHYVDAYEELKKLKYEDAMTDLGQAMESLLKTRFKQTKIEFSEKDTLKKLLDIAQKHATCGDFSFHRFKELILNVGQGRNTNSHGHAEGSKPEIDAIYTRFMINQAAANLLFLAEVKLCHK